MTDFRRVTDQLSVSPQISVAEVAEAARLGFRTLINNRPDGEDPSQPSGEAIAQAAKAAGLAYVAIPIRGGPTPDQVAETKQVFQTADAPVLAYCRSGTRSIVTWAISQAAAGDRGREELIELGRAAGYDLSGVLAG